MEKKDLRNFIRMQKKMFSQQQLDELSEQIIGRLMASPKVKAAKTVLMYYSLDDEVNTHKAVDMLLQQGKEVLLPTVMSDTEMELRRYTGPQDLQGGFFNIMEPVGERFDRYEEIDLAVVPGMLHSCLRDLSRFCPVFQSEDIDTLLLAVDLQLLDRSRTIDVQGNQQGLAAL